MKLFRQTCAAMGLLALGAHTMRADEVSDLRAEVQLLKQQVAVLEQKVEKAAGAAHPAVLSHAALEPVSLIKTETEESINLPRVGKHGFLERKAGDSLTFYTGAGEITPYGNLDLSFDVITKGLNGKVGPDGLPPVGNMGWMPDVSSNISYAGLRGFEKLGASDWKLVYQLESQIEVSSVAGSSETNSSQSNTVKGALTSRNSYIGLSSEHWGALKFGKTDAPYKNSTMRMNPFYGMVGDYQVIMGNTGGDNRVEFGTRLDHSIWYESPNWKGVALALLYSPGQNRAMNSDNIAAGESDCTGGNIPGSGGITPATCSDGSFSDAFSGSVTYTGGPWYLAAGYERHRRVNRQSDVVGLYSTMTPYATSLEMQDVAAEDAGKVGAQYRFRKGTTLNAVWETMHRYVPAELQFQNERQRQGAWLAFSQQVTKLTNVSVGWGHAFRTPGDPGQHNSSFATPPGGTAGQDFTGGAGADNRANLIAFALKYQAAKKLGFYGSWALTANGPAAHYDLGAGGRAVATDCHDASDATGGLVASNPHCWTGGQLKGASVGMDWKF